MRNLTNLFILICIFAAMIAAQDHRVLTILVNFQDNASEPYTVADTQASGSNVDAYYREVSYSRTSFSFDAAGWFTLPMNAVCDKTTIASYADAAATNAGYDLSQYQHRIYAFPSLNCGFSGSADINGPRVWINGPFGYEKVSHELGHNLGLFHSFALDCGADIIGPTCTQLDYGDVFDVMGASSPAGHFNLFQKERLGYAVVPEITASGTYFITPLELSPSGYKILRGYSSTGVPLYYYIEFRRLIGFDAGYAFYQPFDGVLIHTNLGLYDGYLLDATPETMNWYDSALTVGRTFSDGNISITTESVSDSGATVDVTAGAVATPTPSPSPTCKKTNAKGRCIK